MNRRRLLVTFGAVTGAAWAAAAGPVRAALGSAGPAARLVGVLDHAASAAAVGRAYLRAHPEEAEPDRLVRELSAGIRCQGCDPDRAERTRLRAAIAARIRADFAASRVVQVDGWVLSRTEARLYGLAALT